MLVLTRKHQEKIRIGENITITILKTKGKTVRLGIEAPMEVPVIRGELSFELAADDLDAAGVAEVAEAAALRAGAGESKSADRIRAHWTAKSNGVVATMRPPGSTLTQVSLKRVPRAEFGTSSPESVHGTGPLRAMLERRSAAT